MQCSALVREKMTAEGGRGEGEEVGRGGKRSGEERRRE